MEVIDIGNMRYLTKGASSQGAVNLDNPDLIVSGFVRRTVTALDKLPRYASILMLGGGTYTIPKHTRKDVSFTIAEIDRRLEEVAAQKFGWTPRMNVSTVPMDAQELVRVLSADGFSRYDAVVVDLHDGEDVPEFVLSKDFYDQLSKITDYVIVNQFYVNIEPRKNWDIERQHIDQDGWNYLELTRSKE